MKFTDAQALAVIRDRCLNDFEFFVRYFFKQRTGDKFIFSWHHHAMCEALMRVWRGETTHLIINIPPRYSKTEIVVKMFTAWCYARNPACEFIHLSYSDALAVDNSNAIMDTLSSDAYRQLFPVTLTKAAANAWKTSAGGSFIARATGGQVTGYGAGKIHDFENGNGFGGCVLIDDPLKPDDAYSDVMRTRVNNRWDETIKSRFNSPRTPCIVIMQRIHEDDFCGMLLRDPEFKFESVVLPAIMDEGTDHEHALWPQKHTLEQLQAMRSKNSYMFSSQYQQRPTPLGGGILKGAWFNRYSVRPRIDYAIVTVDTALKEKECNDYQVAECWGLGRDGNIYLLDMMRGRFQAYELETRIPDFWNKCLSLGVPLRIMAIEDKASGTELIQKITNKVARPRIPVRAIQRETSKLTRVMGVQGYIESGYVYLPTEAPFVHDFIEECEAFTANDTHPHDDQIDAMCDAVNILLSGKNVPYSDVL
jgi:predicted phage terminase large subunit-like protein|nr:MAG TPA: Large Terminase [Caudoviricetes sp.]